MSCRPHQGRFPPPQVQIIRHIRYQQAYAIGRWRVFHSSSLLQSSIAGLLAALCEQQTTAIPDRDLRDFGESLQQPGQRHFEPDMIILDIEMTRRRLPQSAHAKHQAIAVPSLFIDLQHGNAGRGARQSSLQPACRLFAAKPMRYRNDKRCGHPKFLSSVNASNRA